MTNRNVEIGVGLFVVAGLVALFLVAMKASNLATFDAFEGYEVTGNFDNIGSLKVRSPVTASGVTVGRVSDIRYSTDSYQAEVTLMIDARFPFPNDTSASIFTAGLLGEQYIGLEPGAEDERWESGDSIILTEPAVVLERLIGQFLYSQAQDE